MEDVVVPIALFGMITAVVIGPMYLKTRERQKLLEMVQTAYDRGQPVAPELIDSLRAREAGPRRSSPERDLRTGVFLVLTGLALTLMAALIFAVDGDEEIWALAGVGLFPGLLGLGYLAFWWAKRGRASDTLDV